MARTLIQSKNSLWYIIQFYWKNANDAHKKSISIKFLILTLLSLSAGIILVFESIQRGEFISALAARDSARFQIALVRFVGILLLSAALLSFSAYFRDRIGLQWRKRLVQQATQAYLTDRRYYYLAADIDNPDQRISEDIRNISQLSALVFTTFLESVVQVIGFVGVLLSISLGLTSFLLIYAVVGSGIVALVFGTRLTRINAEQLKREATFRSNLTNVRENAESIAFYQKQLHQSQRQNRQRTAASLQSPQGHNSSNHDSTLRLGFNQEKTTAKEHFNQVVQNFNRFIRWQLGLDCFQNGYQYLTFILPSLILAPRILAGDLEIGAIVQSQAAFDRIWLSLSLVVVQFEQITALTASTQRLQQLLNAVQKNAQDNLLKNKPIPDPSKTDQAKTGIVITNRTPIRIQNLTIQLPQKVGIQEKLNSQAADYQSVTQGSPLLSDTLIENLSFDVTEPLLITGPSGIGKSALVKAIAGLWKNGQGNIDCPQSNILFLPQQPYMTLGTLRQQLLYPSQSPDQASSQPTQIISDDDLLNALKVVQLEDLTDLDKIADWSGQLSTGEQQRLAFARLLIKQPAYVVLDEATSALSVQQEKDLYQHLATTKTIFVSIGHRPSLLTYHSKVLTITDSKTWTLNRVE
ncbi:MAG: ATP-binding cassette domain-containing protein [Cyanobacteria bacterium J06621_11]